MSISGPHSLPSPGDDLAPKDILAERLHEVGISAKRIINLPEGQKQNDHDHTTPKNQLHPNEVEGNYGVLGGNGLVILDIDTHDPSYEGAPEEIVGLPPTLTVQSPHQGEHRYYAVDGDVKGTRLQAVDIQGAGSYGLGPGSVLDSCRKDWHDCSESGEGEYQILHDRPIAQISVEDIPQVAPQKAKTGSTSQQENPACRLPANDLEVAIARLDLEYNPVAVFRRMKQAAKGDQVVALIQGQYSKAGYPGDRSRAESALVEQLGWWFEDEGEVVWKIMDWVCQLNPQTDTGRKRKWLERDDQWRRTLFDNDWFGARQTYNPRLLPEPGEERPEVSMPTKRFVLEAVLDLGVAEAGEIKAHDQVDRGLRQVQRALKELEEGDLVDWVRKGNHVYYYPGGREDLLRRPLET